MEEICSVTPTPGCNEVSGQLIKCKLTLSQLTEHWKYRQASNISRTLAGNKFVDHSDVVGASHVGTAPTTSSFST